jgi:hypothetical protein
MNKKYLLSLLIIAILSTPLLMSAIPSADAQITVRDPLPIFAYVGAYPNPIGVNQIALVTYRVDQPGGGLNVYTGGFNGSSVTITKPDGTTETKSNLPMDPTSSGWFTYVPTEVGTYTFQMHFPGAEYTVEGPWYNPGLTTWKYDADDSSIVPLVVQEEPIPDYGRSPPLPTEPWTRPIYAENKGWWQAGDNWLMPGYDINSRFFAGTPAFAPYTSAPDSAHVLWTKPIIPGGIVGGPNQDLSYYTGISYEQFFDPLILQGHIMYAEHALTSTSTWGTRFIDLYTGEDLDDMYMDGVSMAWAQVLDNNNVNEHGAIPYIWDTSGSNWLMYDFLPGQQPRLRATLSGMSGLTGRHFYGPKGEILSINIGGNSTHRFMYMFNSTRALVGPDIGFSWGPSGTINASRSSGAAEARSHSPFMGIEWNVTLPDVPGSQGESRVNYEEGYVLASSTDSSTSPYTYRDVGYDISGMVADSNRVYPSTISHLWYKERTDIGDIHNRVSNNMQDGVYARFDEGEEIIICYDMQTGNERWRQTPPDNAWALFNRNYEIAYGKIVTSGFDGTVRCFNVETGVLEWEYYKGSSGFENAYGTYPEYAGLTIADRTVYTTADEHSSDGVLWRGAQLWALDIDTGEVKWQINGMFRHPAIADGILVALNSYDGQVYAFGKGPSKTTVSAPQTQITFGEKVVIQGTVTDQTPASKDTPAISDESMGLWMEYLHQQKEFPASATGVEVMIDVIDSNGNYRNIGTATSTTSGFFDLEWTPDIPGKFRVIATFAGSDSYGSSWAETSMTVVEAPEPTPSPTPTPAPMTDTYLTGSTIAIIAAIAIAVFLILRKK